MLIPNIKLFLVTFQGTTIRKVTNTGIFMGEKQKELTDGENKGRGDSTL